MESQPTYCDAQYVENLAKQYQNDSDREGAIGSEGRRLTGVQE